MTSSRIFVSTLFLLLSGSALRCNGQASPAAKPVTTRGRPVIEISQRVGMGDATELAIASTPLRDGSVPPASLQRTDVSESYRQPFANAAMNSRLDGAVTTATYRRKWERPLNQRVVPRFALRAGDRIVAQGNGVYQLFNTDGTSVAVNEYGTGGVVMDARPQLLYAASRNADFTAIRMGDGTEQFNTPLTFGETFTRPLLTRQGWRIVMVGVEKMQYPHAPKPVNLSVIETKTMTSPIRLTSMRELLSVDSAESLIIQSSALQAAVTGEHLVFAVPGRIYFSGINLRIASAYDADFEPVSISLDENARAHMIVKTAGRSELWVVSPTGERSVRYVVKPEYGEALIPPVIGYDHRIYLVMRNHIVALSSDGKVQWETNTQGTVVGAGITKDDQLLVTVGASLTAYNATGASHVVHDFLGDTLRTPPTITDGEIVVASSKKLYCLVR